MNQRQCQELLNTLNRAGLLPLMEGQSAVWLMALHDVSPADAQRAASLIVRNRTSADRWLTPGDFRAVVAEIMRGAVQVARPEIDERMPATLRGIADYAWRPVVESAMRSGATLDQAVEYATDRLGSVEVTA